MEHSYYLIYKTKKGGGELLFNVGTEDKTSTLLRLRGRKIQEIFNGILPILSKNGCVTPIQTGNPRIYSIRDDVGPVLGAYLIPVRRAQKTDYWITFLNELLTGEYSRLGEVFSTFLETTIDLSKSMTPSSRRPNYTLSPIIVSSFSSALKVFVKTLKKREKSIRTC
ncbi:hypothetical protein J7K27_07665 [Candidatus Bathyarchaeota archaeon]|nr:hypothetical protein [Candidatus Bathyarchaeota archaeon]